MYSMARDTHHSLHADVNNYVSGIVCLIAMFFLYLPLLHTCMSPPVGSTNRICCNTA